MKAILLASLAAALLFGQPAEWTQEKSRRLEQAIEQERLRQDVVGLTAAVSQHGTLRWIEGFGKADLESGTPARASTLYRLGSISKPITAIGVMQLGERGRVDLASPVQRYVPSFPLKQWTVTVRDIMSHLSGIRNYRGDELASTRHYNTILEPLAIFSSDPLVTEPRTKYAYSTYNYCLVGAVLEAAAGVSYLDYIRDNIFVPAHMEHTRDDNQRAVIPNRARGYSHNRAGRVINALLFDSSNKIPGGGLIASAEDIAAFAGAIEAGVLVKPATWEKMTTRQHLLDGKPTGYGLGWNVSPVAGHPAISHGGSQPGCRTILAMFPALNTIVVVLTNSDYADIEKFVDVILKALEPHP